MKAQFEDSLDDTNAKINELDGRVSNIEEKDFKSQVTEEDKISVSADDLNLLRTELD